MRLRTWALCLLIVGVGLSVEGKKKKKSVQKDAAGKPNVVFFLVDDLGWMDLSCQGSKFYQTPNIDRLAKQGVRFTDAYAACCVCSPTRSAILTGKYPARTLMTTWLPAGRWNPKKHKLKEGRFARVMALEEVTLAETLREEGYETFFAGKWHLGGAPFYLPEHQGFDINIGGDDHGAPGSYFYPFKGKWSIPTTGKVAHKQAYDGGKEGDYLTDVLTDEAIAFLDKKHRKPFLLYFSYYNVHTPLQGKKDKIAKYKEREPFGGQDNAVYAAMIESVDDSVGRIMARLEEMGAADNTIIVFTSDNGNNAKASSAVPLRANKGSNYEGGIRVPAIIKIPGLGTGAGKTCSQPIISTDYYPTILEAAGIDLKPHQHVDGISLLPWLRQPARPNSDRPLFWHFPHYLRHPNQFPCSVIRAGDWKLIVKYDLYEEGEQIELFNLKNDLGETQNLTARNPEVVKRLQAKLSAWKEEVGAQEMQPNPRYEGK